MMFKSLYLVRNVKRLNMIRFYRYFSVENGIQITKREEDLWDNIYNFFQMHGHVRYEHVSQADHALQSATIAWNEKKDATLAIGAFLHDIGHLIEYERKGMDYFDDDRQHEQIGYDYLNEIGIKNERILNSILYHVEAKRYLCYKDKKYHDTLSKASQHTLQLQGGVFTDAEAKQFEQIPFYEEVAYIRQCDDKGKMIDPDDVLDMNSIKQLFFKAITE
eukprot:405855_1